MPPRPEFAPLINEPITFDRTYEYFPTDAAATVPRTYDTNTTAARPQFYTTNAFTLDYVTNDELRKKFAEWTAKILEDLKKQQYLNENVNISEEDILDIIRGDTFDWEA